MKSKRLTIFNEFQNVLVICPRCGEIHRLSELSLMYRGRIRHTWLDKLRGEEDKIARVEERFEEKRSEIRAIAQEKAYRKASRQIPMLLKKCVPVIASHGYYPQDIKALFDPVDFVVFDGMNKRDMVKKVVLFDGPAHNRQREIIQKSIKKVIRKGNYKWQTVRLNDSGKIA